MPSAGLAQRSPARPLVRPARRGDRSPGVESVQPAGRGFPALVHGRRVDLRPGAPPPPRARRLSGAAVDRGLHRDLDRLRALHRADRVVPLSCGAAADGARECSGRARRGADARPGAARRDRAPARAAPLGPQRLVRRLSRRLRAFLWRPPWSADPIERRGRCARVGRAPRSRLCLASWPTS